MLGIRILCHKSSDYCKIAVIRRFFAYIQEKSCSRVEYSLIFTTACCIISKCVDMSTAFFLIKAHVGLFYFRGWCKAFYV